ncbi:hypothetical protein F0P96_09330 [Hymenobacter busanensis]|uniref:Uncharacterized protein n=1 Tax=Hymenobacter busanensis TaxID=2607656 RepID=A0A7L4ZYX9_9BACT|nr:hypothetical protein [Hymenobacter busanensis]KAA9333171.1 hypothetical protein F0P96_09330 [Hymenobacter busanensis]QHJ08153.1 hypothetical protein GUY19_12995 [Hymenobacter busanensis]
MVSTKLRVAQQRVPQQLLSTKGDFLQILGTVFAVGGIVLGVAVGGWAGFGWFALCALVGLLVAFWGSFVIDGNLP